MNRTERLCIASLFSLLMVASAYSEQTTISLVIAPPPVGYPKIAAGSQNNLTGVNGVYATWAAENESITFVGATTYLDYQKCPSDRIAVNGSTGITFLFGDKYDFLALQVPISGNLIYKVFDSFPISLFAFGGAGGTIGLSTMTVTIPQWIPYTVTFVDDDTTLTTMTLTGSLTAGLQANITVSSFIISPFGSFLVSGGKYSTTQTSTMSYSYPSTSGTIDTSQGFILGFDVLYVPLNLALSSQFRKDSDYTLITVALKWSKN